MAKIKAGDSLKILKKLRLSSGAGVLACRRALKEAQGDFNLALKILQKKGGAIVAKKAKRETKEGVVASYIHNDSRVAAMVVLFCETDFVARTDEFKKLAHELAMQVAAMNPRSKEELLAQEYIRDSRLKVGDLVKKLIAKTKENIRVGQFTRMAIGDSSD